MHEYDSLTSRHKITQTGLYSVRINQSINPKLENVLEDDDLGRRNPFCHIQQFFLAKPIHCKLFLHKL